MRRATGMNLRVTVTADVLADAQISIRANINVIGADGDAGVYDIIRAIRLGGIRSLLRDHKLLFDVVLVFIALLLVFV